MDTVAILPFSTIDQQLVRQLKQEWQKRLSVPFVVLDEKPLPPSAFYKPRQRYIADSLLGFLEQVNSDRYEKIIGVTAKDISTQKGENPNWGILGLGTCPGRSCVISSFRAGKKKVAAKDFVRRMTILGLHELGHTWGLEHCENDSCLMKDAEGKMNLDNGQHYCDQCLEHLKSLGILYKKSLPE